jgi:hypothetical protein
MSDPKSVEQLENNFFPQTKDEKDLVRREMENVLRDPLFLASKRYPSFLRYVVEETIEGRGDQLKERTLGIEVFGRDAGYDNTQDNVVRVTATETRKRLAQYYVKANGTSNVRIVLASGSYTPKFVKQSPPVAARRHLWPRAGVVLLVVLFLGGIGSVAWRMLQQPIDPIALFWGPFIAWKNPILVCIGARESRDLLTLPYVTESNPASPQKSARPNDLYVRFSSAVNLAKFSLFLESRGTMCRMTDDYSTSFSDLRSGPAILVGINKWAMSQTATLRFRFEWEPAAENLWISDRQNPSRRDWAGKYAMSDDISKDYALISRFFDPTLGQWIVVATGMHRFGNAASLEFLSNQDEMQVLADHAPKGWDKLNLQVVIATNVIQGSNGPPQILESYFWQR